MTLCRLTIMKPKIIPILILEIYYVTFLEIISPFFVIR